MEDSISQYFESKDIPDPTSNFQWEYILIDNKKMKNAWCMPGGKIAVYTGMLEITKNEDGLAAVMVMRLLMLLQNIPLKEQVEVLFCKLALNYWIYFLEEKFHKSTERLAWIQLGCYLRLEL